MMQSPIHIVWFKRDLRINDHAPLHLACASGKVLPLFVWEPSLWIGDDYVKQHQVFIAECLNQLRKDLRQLGLELIESQLSMVETLSRIRAQTPIQKLYSHEETGNAASYEIDKRVLAWCKENSISWQEVPQNGVVRRLKNRNQWNSIWEQRMSAPLLGLPENAVAAEHVSLPTSSIIVAQGTDKAKRQLGGRDSGLALFTSFLDGRAAKFRGGISSPLSAVTAGSRLSPYLAYGCLSMREVVQATRDRQIWADEVPHMFPARLNTGLVGFESRLHWHCHFMQKLESEPEMEFENVHHAHDDMRDESLADIESQRRLQLWRAGHTGWPLVDACMAMLRETGWINFRMRAMLMSTASYLYWLHWRSSGQHLAREFLDYEPGIHWAQTQMQSGTTGINTLRIYSPVKQAQDHDPTGAFVRHWLPALKNVPNTWIFEPHLMPKAQQLQYGCVLDKDYPTPIIEIGAAMRAARAKIVAARRKQGAYEESQAIIKKHASRKRMQGSERDKNGQLMPSKRTRKKSKLSSTNTNQQELF